MPTILRKKIAVTNHVVHVDFWTAIIPADHFFRSIKRFGELNLFSNILFSTILQI